MRVSAGNMLCRWPLQAADQPVENNKKWTVCLSQCVRLGKSVLHQVLAASKQDGLLVWAAQWGCWGMTADMVFCGVLASLWLLGVTQAAVSAEAVTVPSSELLCLGGWRHQAHKLSRAKRAWGFSGYLNQFFKAHRQYYDFVFPSLQGHKKVPHCLILQDIHGAWTACLLSRFHSACSPEHWHHVV